MSDWRVTNALEELDTLLSLQLLEMPVLFDELLLLLADPLILQCERHFEGLLPLKAIAGLTRLHGLSLSSSAQCGIGYFLETDPSLR